MMYVLEYLVYHLKPYGRGIIQQCPETSDPHDDSVISRLPRSSKIPVQQIQPEVALTSNSKTVDRDVGKTGVKASTVLNSSAPKEGKLSAVR